jgi:chromosome segregation ATPase
MNDICSHFTTACPGCLVELKINSKYSGQWVRCQHCDKKFQATTPDSTATETSQAPPTEDGSRLNVACPSCATMLSVRAKYAGRNIRCSGCGHKFQVNGQASVPSGDSSLASLTEATAELTAKQTRLRDRQRELRRALLQLHSEVQRIAAQTPEADGERAVGELKRLHDELRTDLDLLKQRVEAAPQPAPAEHDLAPFQQRHDELAAAFDDLKRRIESDARPAQFDRDLAELWQGHDESSRLIAQLQAQIRSVEDAEAEQRDAFQARRDEFNAAIDDLKAQVRAVEAEARAPRADEHRDVIEHRHNALTTAIERLEGRIQGLEADARPAQLDHGLAELARRHDLLHGRSDDLAAAINDLNDRVRAIADDERTSQRDQDVADLTRRHDALKHAVDLLTERTDAHHAQRGRDLDDAQQRHDLLLNRHDELAAAIDDLKRRIESDERPAQFDRGLAELRMRHDETARLTERLQNELRTVEGHTASLREQDVAGLAQRLDALSSSIEDVRGRLRTIEADAAPARHGEDVAELAPKLDDLKREIDLLKRRSEAEAPRADGGREQDAVQLDGLIDRQNELAAALDALTVQIQTAETGGQPVPSVRDFAALKAQADESQREVDLLKMRLNGAENQSNRSSREAAALREQYAQLAGRHEEAARAIADLKARFQAAQEELVALKEQKRSPLAAPSFANITSIEGPAAFAFHGRSRSPAR